MKQKTFLINLDHCTERWDYCSSQFKLLGLDFERISAIYGKNLSQNELNQCYSPELNLSQYHKKLNSGEIGCYLSHRLAWKKIVDDALDYAIILEDDIEISDNFIHIFKTIENLKVPWDYIKLSNHRNRKIIFSKNVGNFDLVLFNKLPALTCGQVVSLKGARKLLKESEKFGRPIDIDLQYWWEKNILALGLKPFVISSNNKIKSEINTIAHRHNQVGKLHKKLINQILFKIKAHTKNKILINKMYDYKNL